LVKNIFIDFCKYTIKILNMNNEYIKNKLMKLVLEGKIQESQAEDIYELYLEEIDDTSIETAIELTEQDIEESIENNV